MGKMIDFWFPTILGGPEGRGRGYSTSMAFVTFVAYEASYPMMSVRNSRMIINKSRRPISGRPNDVE